MSLPTPTELSIALGLILGFMIVEVVVGIAAKSRAASEGVAGDILAKHEAGEEPIRERLASLLEREAPEIAVKLRTPKRRSVRRRSRG
ncbi:MAG: hypothetical protein ACJ76Z_09375 [Thermoleophilaceae bacterium]